VSAFIPRTRFLPSTPTVKTVSGRPCRPGSTWTRAHVDSRTCQRVRAGVGPRGLAPHRHGMDTWVRVSVSARTCMDTCRVDSGPCRRGIRGGQIRVSCIKGGELPFSLTSNQSWLNSWGLKRCVHTSFSPDWIVGFLIGSPLQTRGEVFLFCRFFRSCWFEDV
jgi:hypothetical protein